MNYTEYLPINPIRLAEFSTHPRHRHIAIILHKGLLIGYANNTVEQHAEVRAITVAALHGYRKDLTLISMAIDKGGKLKLAKPCKACQLYCEQRGIETILFSTKQQTVVKMTKENR